MLEPSILRYDRAEHEEIHLTCGSHIACFGVQIWSSFTTSTVFEMPAWTLNVLAFIHLQYYRVLGLWTSNHPTMTDSILLTWAAAHVGLHFAQVTPDPFWSPAPPVGREVHWLEPASLLPPQWLILTHPSVQWTLRSPWGHLNACVQADKYTYTLARTFIR